MIQDRGCGDPVERGSISIGIEFVCACSVGLRRSEIDGYFERSHLCPRDVARLCGNQFIWNSDRKFIQNTGSHSCTIPITAVGCLFSRATSLGDRRLLWLRRLEIDGYFLLPPSDFLGLLALLSLLLVLFSALLPLSDDVSDF